jgi:hypothetical protein
MDFFVNILILPMLGYCRLFQFLKKIIISYFGLL